MSHGRIFLHDGTIEVRGDCERCGGAWAIALPARGWHLWRSGAAGLHDAFPGVTPERTAALVEGVCAACHAARLAEADAS